MATFLGSHMGEEEEVREGLLCSICLQDLGTINQLQEHFDSVHSFEDKDVLQSLKGFLGKAKRKILNKQDSLLDGSPRSFYVESSEPGRNQRNIYPVLFEPQEMGIISRHTDYFKKIRDTKVDRYVIETNKLLIRLDKLITDAPVDPEKRKVHEKNIVPWIADNDVKLCPSCARSFNLSRRRHHCRLCGGIMCHNCSEFLDFYYARKLLHPGVTLDVATQEVRPMLQRRGSSSSLLSIVSTAGEPHIRVCHNCKVSLDRRDQFMEQKNSKPIIVQMYERMREHMTEILGLLPLYYKMADALSYGETSYSLKDAQELRMKLTKLAENIDIISRKISVLGTRDEPSPSPKSLQLQGCVRYSASNFLRDNILGLPLLPSEEELHKLQEEHRREVHQRIQQEKQAALEARQFSPTEDASKKNGNRQSFAHTINQDMISVDTGWTPGTVECSMSMDDDPMVQQMNIIRNFIKQAREAHRYDEVRTLEENLKELQQEYLKQKSV